MSKRSVIWHLFQKLASFGDPHYISRTSPHSIYCAWNSRFWSFEFRKTLLPRRNLNYFLGSNKSNINQNLKFCFLQRFRPVVVVVVSLLIQLNPRAQNYLDHEGNRTGDISPSWGQPNTRVHTVLSKRRARQGPGEGVVQMPLSCLPEP